ncbi:hypothetical protein ACSBR2_007289 [Camellia fascicularis]
MFSYRTAAAMPSYRAAAAVLTQQLQLRLNEAFSDQVGSLEEIEEIAHGLELSKVNFRWVVRFPMGEKVELEEALPKTISNASPNLASNLKFGEKSTFLSSNSFIKSISNREFSKHFTKMRTRPRFHHFTVCYRWGRLTGRPAG